MKCDIEKCKAWCCKYIFIGDKIDPEMLMYWSLRGAILIEGKWAIPCRCQWLDDNNRCKHYDRRPEFCKEWYCGKSADDSKTGEGKKPEGSDKPVPGVAY